MSSTTTISSYDETCSRHRWEVPDGYNIIARPFAFSYITG